MRIVHSRRLNLNRVYSRALLFNGLFAIAVTLIPLMALTEYFIGQYDRQINSYNMQMAQQTENYIDDTIISKIVDIPNSYFSELDSNSELTYPYYHSISNDFVMMQEISTRLKNITDIYSFISGMNLYYPQSGVIFGLSGVSFVDDPGFFKSIQGHEAIVSEMMNPQAPTEWITAVPLLGQESTSPAVFVKVLPYSISGEEKKAVLSVGFSEDFFYQFIRRIQTDQGETLLIVDPKGTVVVSTNRKQNGTVLQNQTLLHSMAKGSESGMLRSRFNGSPSIISYQKSRYNDWRYVSVTSVGNYYRKSTQIRVIILAALVLLLPINLFLSTLLTKKAYRPLSQVVNRIKGMVSGDTAEPSEYHFLENTFRALSSRVEQLSGTLEENRPLIRHNILLKLLQGSSENCTEDECAVGNIRLEGSQLCCCAFRLFFDADPKLEDRLLLEYNLVPVLEGMQGVCCNALLDDGNRLIAVVSYDGMELEEVLRAVSECIHSSIKISYTVCAGGPRSCLSANIRESYREALRTYQYAFVRCNEQILRFDQLQEQPTGERSARPRSVSRWAELLRAGDCEGACRLLEKSVADLSNGSYGIDFIRYTLISIVTSVRMLVIEFGWDEAEMFGGDLLADFEKLGTIREFDAWFRRIVRLVTDRVNSQHKTGMQDMSENIRKYIAENLCHDISLESVARSFFISPGYLSRIFRSEFGMSFTEYLVKLKMERAAKLLREEDCTVKDIANSLGYQSVHYFIRIFKEKYGMTPKAYRQASILQ